MRSHHPFFTRKIIRDNPRIDQFHPSSSIQRDYSHIIEGFWRDEKRGGLFPASTVITNNQLKREWRRRPNFFKPGFDSERKGTSRAQANPGIDEKIGEFILTEGMDVASDDADKTLVPDRAQLINELIEVICKEGMVDRDKVKPDATIDSLGLKSIDFVMILTEIEEKFDVYVPMDGMFQDAGTVQELLDALASYIQKEKS